MIDSRSVTLEIKTTDIKWGKNYNLLIFPLDSNFMFARGGGDYCRGWWRRAGRHSTSQTSKTNENATGNGMCYLAAACLCLIFLFFKLTPKVSFISEIAWYAIIFL